MKDSQVHHRHWSWRAQKVLWGCTAGLLSASAILKDRQPSTHFAELMLCSSLMLQGSSGATRNLLGPEGMEAEDCRFCLRHDKPLRFAASQMSRPTRRDCPRPASRTRARTCLPRCSSRLTTRLPTPPVAPAGQTVEVEHVCCPRGCCAAGYVTSTQAATCWACAWRRLTFSGGATADSVRHALTAATACWSK